MDFNKAKIDNCFYQIAKQYKKFNKNGSNLEIVVVGGASILLNYGFRETTTDIDSYLQATGLLKDIIKKVGEDNNLPNNWLNDDFKYTKSFSPQIVECSKFYKTFYGCLSVRTVSDEYLIAMKLKSFRIYKHDKSDIIGILKENIERENRLDLNKISSAYQKLYNEDLSPKHIEFLNELLIENNLEDLFYNMKSEEDNKKNALIEAEKMYAKEINEDNVASFIDFFENKNKKNSSNDKENDELKNEEDVADDFADRTDDL